VLLKPSSMNRHFQQRWTSPATQQRQTKLYAQAIDRIIIVSKFRRSYPSRLSYHNKDTRCCRRYRHYGHAMKPNKQKQ
jgi:hypothetical protein